MASSSDFDDLADIIDRHKPERSQDSDLPAWIQAHTPVKVPIAISDDSDDAAAQDRTADEATGPAGAAGAGSNKLPAVGTSKAAAGTPGRSKAAAAAAAVAGAGSSKGGAAGTSSQQPSGAAAGLLPAVAVLSGAVGEAVANQIPLILPEKLIWNKVLVELEPAPHQATELSGDAGAVGRIIVDAEAAADGCFKVDLKGVLYQATVLPLAGTALVANIGPTEAKIEGVLNDFVRLREESSYLEGGFSMEGGEGLNALMADDEDNYQLGEDGKEGAGGKAAGKKAAAAGAKRKPAAKGAGAKGGAGKMLKAAGGVKKKAGAGKKAASGKGSRTPSKAKKPKAAAAAKAKTAGKGGKAGGGKAAAAAGGGKAKGGGKKSKKADSESEADFDSESEGGDGADSDWSMD